jgi:hypothetical protein
VEARDVDASDRQRNLSDCRTGLETCNYEKLTEVEAGTLAGAERLRNYRACLKGYGYCDRSRLTPEELKAIPNTSTVPR